MTDKRMTEADVVAELRDGMTIGIGGWGSRRKPMSLVRAILRSPLRDLTVVSYGGPDVGLLCAAGKLRRLIYGFVSLDSVPLEPHFRAARQAGAIEIMELDEGMLQWGLHAAAARLQTLRVNRLMVDGVIEAPLGAHFTSCEPDYERDEAFLRHYAAAAADPRAWAAFRARYLDVPDEAAYREAVESR